MSNPILTKWFIFSILFLITLPSHATCKFPYKKPIYLTYNHGPTKHKAILDIKNCKGRLKVSFYNHFDKKRSIILQDIIAKDSPLGVLVYGNNPRELSSHKPMTTYGKDSFIFQHKKNGSWAAYLCDSFKNCSHVIIKTHIYLNIPANYE